MNVLKLENVSKSYGEKVLLDNVELSISKGQKIALIAKNGSGKTTLLRMIAGQEAPEGERASIFVNKHINIKYLSQEPHFDPNLTILEAVMQGDSPARKAIIEYENALESPDQEALQKAISKVEAENAWEIESRVKTILGKLNLHKLNQKVSTLSGGQKKRLSLAEALIDEPDFLILDEPTNHLDLDMIEWLEQFLSSSHLTLFMVTHDRYFLERVCDEIIELDQGILYPYKGNYSDYLVKRQERKQNESTVLEKTKKLYLKELEWMRRQPQARTTKAKSRIESFYDIKDKAHRKAEQTLETIDIEPARLGSKILELHHVGKAFGPINIVNDFSYKFKKGEKVGIAGRNGTGKTTLVKMMTGIEPTDKGKVVLGETVQFGHFNQEGLQNVEGKKVIDIIREVADYIPLKKGHKMTAEALLERFLFPRPQQQVFVEKLSGGEKRRLQLVRVLMQNPNFLILDEPTNDLDILTMNVLEDYLIQFPGCAIIVSHDRFFMDKIIDHLFILNGNGNIKDFNGSYSEYKLKESNDAKSGKKKNQSSKESDTNPSKEEAYKKGLSYFEQKELKTLPNALEKLEKEKVELEKAFLQNLSADEVTDLSKKLGKIQEEIEAKELRWFELSELQ